MKQSSNKLVIFVLASSLASFGIAFLIVDIQNLSIIAYGVGKFGFVALTVLFLFVALAVLFDGPLGLGLLTWLDKETEPEILHLEASDLEAPMAKTWAEGERKGSFEFPYEDQAEHWNIDFSDSKKTYEGADLPLWLLAGWAAFVIWAVVYLISGLPDAF